MVHFFAVGQAQPLLGVDVFGLHLQHLNDIDGALQILVLGDALIGELPPGQECLHHQVFDCDLFHVSFLFCLFPLTSIRHPP